MCEGDANENAVMKLMFLVYVVYLRSKESRVVILYMYGSLLANSTRADASTSWIRELGRKSRYGHSISH